MMEKANKADEEYTKKVEEELKPLREKSDFMKVMAFNHPKSAILFAAIGVAIAGGLQPILGWIWADMLFTLSIPVEYLKI